MTVGDTPVLDRADGGCVAESPGHQRFRAALGQFATGVAIVTATTTDDCPVGLTVNSFSSVSLEPPLILWSLASSASCLPVFCAASHYAVNVLGADQVELSKTFASYHGDRFAKIAFKRGTGGVPVISQCIAWFECASYRRHEEGDHVIFIGKVERYEVKSRRPLVFYSGSYHVPIAHPWE